MVVNLHHGRNGAMVIAIDLTDLTVNSNHQIVSQVL